MIHLQRHVIMFGEAIRGVCPDATGTTLNELREEEENP